MRKKDRLVDEDQGIDGERTYLESLLLTSSMLWKRHSVEESGSFQGNSLNKLRSPC